MTIMQLQALIAARWGSATYVPDVDHPNHAALHLMKALGKVAAGLEQAEHRDGEVVNFEPQLADLVICSVRLAELWDIDLEHAIADRIDAKFPADVPPTVLIHKCKFVPAGAEAGSGWVCPECGTRTMTYA